MTEREEMLAVLAWSGLPQVGERTLLLLLDHAREARLSMTELWRSRPEDLAQIVPLHPRALAVLRESAPAVWAQAAADLDEAHSRGAELLLSTQPDYPSALWQLTGRGARRWPYVFAFGALGLLEEPRVALVSSRNVSPEGLAITDALADSLARRDLSLVTSTNREAYQAAATAAKRHAGPSVMALDRGFDAALPSGLHREPVATARVWDEAFDPELQLLLSPFGWRESWTARNGKRRDSLIFDLADVVVAVDVRAGGHIEHECRRAAVRGRAVIALDRGDNTPDGACGLWEATGVQRVAWRGGDAAAQAIVGALPSLNQEAAAERVARGWLREVSLFLCRAAAAAGGQAPTVGAYPEKGVLAVVAQLWSARGRDRSAGLDALVADLWSKPGAALSRVGQLLSRVAPGGVMVALVPTFWLTEAQYEAPRAGWLEGASLRYTVELPSEQSHGGARSNAAAVVVLQRQPTERAARSFSPEGSVAGRFHLRRYLREVLSVIHAEQDVQRRS